MQTATGAADGIGYGLHRFLLANDALFEALFHFDELLAFALEHPRHRHAGPHGHHPRDVLIRDFLIEEPLAGGLFAQCFFGCRQLLLQFGQLSILDL